jgi:hypothetical protein
VSQAVKDAATIEIMIAKAIRVLSFIVFIGFNILL